MTTASPPTTRDTTLNDAVAVAVAGKPNAAFAAIYNFYSRRILPWVGGLLTGSREAYRYLPDSVRKFPSADRLKHQMTNAGFREVQYEFLTGGIVALHLGIKA